MTLMKGPCVFRGFLISRRCSDRISRQLFISSSRICKYLNFVTRNTSRQGFNMCKARCSCHKLLVDIPSCCFHFLESFLKSWLFLTIGIVVLHASYIKTNVVSSLSISYISFLSRAKMGNVQLIVHLSWSPCDMWHALLNEHYLLMLDQDQASWYKNIITRTNIGHCIRTKYSHSHLLIILRLKLYFGDH